MMVGTSFDGLSTPVEISPVRRLKNPHPKTLHSAPFPSYQLPAELEFLLGRQRRWIRFIGDKKFGRTPARRCFSSTFSC